MERQFDQHAKKQRSQHSPTSFMRARRPELYSDSVSVEVQGLEQSLFEFHLHTLTQRKEETRFEHFCRRLAEKELCPNLLPQTGPTGGGDSKVDSETYPVAEPIAERWYEGDPNRAPTERWAFAISAKAQWKPKVKDDVRKVAETKRGYTLVYFMTNQAVADRERAAVEDELRGKWNLDVRILDRTWIIEKIVQSGRWEVVYQTLDIDAPAGRSQPRTGPLDTQRTEELEELDALIEDTGRYVGAGLQLLEDCLQSALIARALGRPRTEVDGRFDRAQRMAEKHKSDRQLFRVYYERAWTANWWFDDYDELNRLYELAEPLALRSEHVWDLEKLGNLWQVGVVWARASDIPNPEDWSSRTERLRVALLNHTVDASKSTSALWARTQLLFMDLTAAVGNDDAILAALSNLKTVLVEAEGHIDYPADTVAHIIEEMSEVLGGSDVLDDVFETAVELRASRLGRGKEGEMRLKRGLQKLAANKPYDAIRQCAAAQALLAQQEHRDEFVRALGATGLAYEAAGLLWAARANVVVALERTMYQYSKEGTIKGIALSFVRKLVWLELQLGRVPCALAWLAWIEPLLNIIAPENETVEEVNEEYSVVDLVLGILMLRTKFSDWSELTWAPALLDNQDLPRSSIAALFCLGDMETLRAELGDEQIEGMEVPMAGWLLEPVASDLQSVAQWNIGPVASMRTVLLGCEVEFVAENSSAVVLIAEALLGYLEALLSTAIDQARRPISARPHLLVEVRVASESGSEMPLELNVLEDECGETRICVTLLQVSAANIVQHEQYRNVVHRFLGHVLEQLHLPTAKEWVEKLLQENGSLARAFLAARSVVSTSNVLGDLPKYRASDWESEHSGGSSRLYRTKPWSDGMPALEREAADSSKPPESSEFADGPPPENLFGVDGLKHRDVLVLSPINIPLWDRARWGACAYFGGPDGLPELHLCFRELSAGEKIFRGWRKKVGTSDVDDWIGVTLITGVDRMNPAHYVVSISIGQDYVSGHSSPKGQFAMVSRYMRMTPADTKGRDAFMAHFQQRGAYSLAVSGMAEGRLVTSKDFSNLVITKRRLRMVPAWKIGPNHPACGSIQEVTDPVVPLGVTDVPFRRLEEARKSRRPI